MALEELAFVVCGSVDVVTILSWVGKAPIAKAHVIATCDGVVACDCALCHLRAKARNENLAAGI